MKEGQSMSQERFGEATRRAFLGTATVATAATLTAPVVGEAQTADTGHLVGTIKLAEPNADVPAQLMSRAKAGDWTKPAAMAIPKEGYFELEKGRYGPIFPKTPANYGFTIIAKIKPGREEVIRAYGKKNRGRYSWRSVCSRPAQAPLPEMGPLQHRQRHVFHVPRDIRY
jgi:hypothetical protein